MKIQARRLLVRVRLVGRNSVFQFWFSFIWFVVGLCWVRSASVC